MTYQITFETADGSLEHWADETSRARAEKTARSCAKTSAINEPMEVTRWFVEENGLTISCFPVAA
jgi:hypothetical protein